MKNTILRTNCVGAWSLIELLGVVAILGIIGLALAPALLRQVIEANRSNEQQILEQLAKGFRSSILRHHYIPGANDFAETIARELGWSEDKVRYNRIGQERVYLIDPQLSLGQNGTSLPYRQSNAGSLPPTTSARVLFLSSLSAPLPPNIRSGSAPSKEVFDAIWNAGINQVPTGWTWPGQGADLRIQRVHLAPMFVELILWDEDGVHPRYSVDDWSDDRLLAKEFRSYFIIGTRLKLMDVDGNVQAREILRDSCSYIFEDGLWRDKWLSSKRIQDRLKGPDLEEALGLFMGVQVNTNVPGLKNFDAAFRVGVSNCMVAYLRAYVNWAELGFPDDPKIINQLRKLAQDLDSATRLKP